MGEHVYWFMGGAAIFAFVCLIYVAVTSIKERFADEGEDKHETKDEHKEKYDEKGKFFDR